MMHAKTVDNQQGTITSGSTLSVWLGSSSQKEFETLSTDIETDILIVGGGIAGISTAYCLTKAGRNVTLIEDGLLFSGETGRTTAHVVNALDDMYSDLN
jgi:heterodisulfide reductase subunit A-like polyferredoxin